MSRQRSRVVAACAAAVLAAGLASAADEVLLRLLDAVARGDTAELARSLRDGADPDRGDAGGWTALHEAAARRDRASTRALLEAGARPDRRARARGTPLDVAESEGAREVARLLRDAGARGSGKSIGDTVCVRRWSGDGYCAAVVERDPTRFQLLIRAIVGCEQGCRADAACSAGRSVGGSGLDAGERLWVPASCLTHTGVR